MLLIESSAALQVALGVTTLMANVPVSLGSLHQANALLLLTVSLGLMHTLRRGPRSPSLPPSFLSQYGSIVAAAGVLGIGGAVTLPH